MQFDAWDGETRFLFGVIQRYERASRYYLRGKPTPDSARRLLNQTFEELVAALRLPGISERLANVISSGGETDEQVAEVISDLTRSQIDLEIELAENFGLKKNDVKRIFLTPSNPEVVQRIASAEGLISRISDFHLRLVHEVEEARGLERVGKKRRKRDIARAVTSVAFGTGCAVANSFVIAGMPAMAASYAVTLTTFHQAARDVVGKPDDDD